MAWTREWADNQLYVTADPAGVLPLLAVSNAVPNELFQWIDNGDGTISLRSLSNYWASAFMLREPLSINTNINPGLDESFAVKSPSFPLGFKIAMAFRRRCAADAVLTLGRIHSGTLYNARAA